MSTEKRTIWGTLKKPRTIIIATVLALVLVFSGIQINIPTDNSGAKVFTIGWASAEATTSYIFNGDPVHDTAQMLAALNALSINGGRIIFYQIPTGDIYFNAQITRAIPNVVLESNGCSTRFCRDGINPVFVDGGNNWGYINVAVDAGDINHGAYTGWIEDPIIINGIPRFCTQNGYFYNTGRTATVVVAANDSPDIVKAQADYVCTGTNDQTTIQVAIIAAVPSKGHIYLADGNYLVSASLKFSLRCNAQNGASKML